MAPFQALAASLPYRASLLSDDLAFFEWLQRQAVCVRQEFAFEDRQRHVTTSVHLQHFRRHAAVAKFLFFFFFSSSQIASVQRITSPTMNVSPHGIHFPILASSLRDDYMAPCELGITEA